MKKLLVSLMLIIGSAAGSQTVNALDPSQVYSTGNIVNSGTTPTDSTGTWQNIGLWNQGLPCWGPDGPVYCGPLPYYNQGSFNFSYGTADVYQIANIAKALPNSGTGLKVDGYNFSFTAKNGNGWDGGRLDYLYAYVHFTDKNDGVVYYKSYDLNYVFNWTTFNYSETFKTPYASKDLNNVTYGFVGRDNNFWAGPYGPEIYNVNFSLKYSVDQCAISVLSSPTCPGYLDALAKIIPQSTTVANDTSSTTTTPTTTVTTTVNDDPVNPTVTVTSAPTTTVNNNTQQTNNTTTTTVTSSQQRTTTSSGTNIGLSVISRNQQREQNIASTAVQNAISTSESASSQSQQEALAVASMAVSNSTVSSVTSSNQTQTGTGIRIQSNNTQFGLSSNNMSSTTGIIENTVNGYNNALTDRTNPLNEYIEPKTNLANSNQPTVNSTVNRNAGNNEVAGGVDINKMALAPTGYNDYLNLTLRDSEFYAPKEVYKNQKNVDNAKALRQLTNDTRHRDMVDEQYRR